MAPSNAAPTNTPEPGALSDPGALVDYAKSLDCIHCGLCLQTCPTYLLSGVESSSPRGRIHLMRAVGEKRQSADQAYAEELDFCLLCRHCESVCPAGVRFGEMMTFARARYEAQRPRSLSARLLRFLGLRVLLPHRLALRLAGSGLRFLQVTGLETLASHFGKLGTGLPYLPRIPPLMARRLLAPRIGPGTNELQKRVGLLQGCVMPELYARVNRATASSLNKLGVECDVPPELVCCGSLHAHNGDHERAVGLVQKMITAFEHVGDGKSPIVVNSAGCGAHMRECSHLFEPGSAWHRRAQAFEQRVIDYSEYVARELEEREIALGLPSVPQPIAWDDPCHLCHGQGVRQPPRSILGRMVGLTQAPLSDPEACCGSAGIYSLTHPEDSQAIFQRKLEDLEASGAQTLVTANPGCQLQWESGLRRAGKQTTVVHLAELVEDALSKSASQAR